MASCATSTSSYNESRNTSDTFEIVDYDYPRRPPSVTESNESSFLNACHSDKHLKTDSSTTDHHLSDEVKKINEDNIKVSRLNEDKSPAYDWVFGEYDATNYARAIVYGCVKNRGVKKTVEEIEAAGFIPTDQSEGSKLIRYYMNEARERNDPVFLLRAYTVDGSFYNDLNRHMVAGSSKDVFKKLQGGWSGYYTGVLMNHPGLYSYRWCGETYRGFDILRTDFDKHYKVGAFLTNKTFQSTTKSMEVAKRFAQGRPRFVGKMLVIITRQILDDRSALDIEYISQFPAEQEVLVVPGVLFEVVDIRRGDITEVKVRQILTHNA